MSKKISVGIDVGTYQVKVLVSESSEEESMPKVIGLGISESKGLRHGYIINTSDVIKNLKIAVSQAERTSKIKIKNAYLSVGGIGLSSITTKGSIMISRADLEITDIDIKNALTFAEENIPSSVLLNKKIIHTIPISYKIDGQTINGRPLGMKGAKLEIRVMFIMCIEQHLNDLIKCVNETGIEVLNVMASPLAGSLVTLSKTQKVAGCILANIGSETVSLVVYENNIPISLEIYPIGGTDITNDIALGFKIPIEEAESLKLRTVDDSQYPKKKLDEIIFARLSDIFELIEAHLKKIGRNGLLPAGIILSGGGSGIETIEDLARASLKLPSRIAQSGNMPGLKNEQIKDSTWSVAYGLSVWGLQDSDDMPEGIRISENILDVFKNWIRQYLP
jgi:cell division protein FtsA